MPHETSPPNHPDDESKTLNELRRYLSSAGKGKKQPAPQGSCCPDPKPSPQRKKTRKINPIRSQIEGKQTSPTKQRRTPRRNWSGGPKAPSSSRHHHGRRQRRRRKHRHPAEKPLRTLYSNPSLKPNLGLETIPPPADSASPPSPAPTRTPERRGKQSNQSRSQKIAFRLRSLL